MQKQTKNFHWVLFSKVLPLIVICVLIYGVIFSAQTVLQYYKQNQGNVENLTISTGKHLDGIMQDMNELALYISTNSDVRDAYRQLNSNPNTLNPLLVSSKLNTLSIIGSVKSYAQIDLQTLF